VNNGVISVYVKKKRRGSGGPRGKTGKGGARAGLTQLARDRRRRGHVAGGAGVPSES